MNLLFEDDARGTVQFRLAADQQQVIEPCRPPIADADLNHREHHARLGGERGLRMTAGAQPFGARTLEKAQVIGVVDDPAPIGVLPVDPRRPDEAAHEFSPNRGRFAAARSGTFSPKCCQALRVAMRPRAVRARNPCWIRNGSMTSSSVPRSSPIAAARLSMPTGPPSNFSITVSNSFRSSASKPSGSTDSRSSAALATLSSIRPLP